jgi:hypothetical protein
VIYVYAIVESPPPCVATMSGLAGASLRCVTAGPVAAVCSAHDRLDLRADVETMWAHERVTAGLLQQGPVVPVRFGTVLASSEEVGALVSGGSGRYQSLLSRFRGRVELSLRARMGPGVRPPAPPAAQEAASPGVAYLQARRPAPLASPLEELHGDLAARSVASTVRSAPEEMVAAYLADAHDVGWFQARVARAAREAAGLSTRLTGPWAPFSFTEEAAHAG